MSTVAAAPARVNRVAAAISQLRERIPQRIAAGQTTQADIDKLHESLDLDLGDYCRFQERKSLAFASGVISLPEAQLIYQYLGNTPEQFNRQSVEVKTVLTQVFAELLGRG